MAMTMPMVGIIGRNEIRQIPGKGAANAHPDFVDNHTVPAVLNKIVLDGGFAPMNLPPFADEALVEHNASMMSGLVFFGGSDWHPTRSGIAITDQTIREGMEYDDPRDQAELAYLDFARRWGIPVLGLCRGAQGMNIIHGGTLKNIDHLTSPYLNPDHPNNHFNIDHPDGPYAQTHGIGIRFTGSTFSHMLSESIGSTEIPDSSSAHHHANDHLGEGLYIVGVSSGDEQEPIIEIIADKTGRMVGAQGHPEMQRGHPWSKAIFANFFDFANRFEPIVSRDYSEAPDTAMSMAGYAAFPPA